MRKTPWLFIFFLMTCARTFGQDKNPVIVFDTGTSTFSSTDETFFSADGKYLAVADLSNVNPSIKVIDLASGLPVKTIKGESNYRQLEFSKDFQWFRFNRLPMSDTDATRFEAVRNTFTGTEVFKRTVPDSRIGPKVAFLGNRMLQEYEDSVVIIPPGSKEKGIILHGRNPSVINGQLFFEPSYGNTILKIFDPQANSLQGLDFTKEDASLMTPTENADQQQNKHNTYTLKSYSLMIDSNYIIAGMESLYGNAELLKVYDRQKGSVIFSAEKLKYSYQDNIFTAAIQFDRERGTLTYPVKEGLAVADVFSRKVVVIPFAKAAHGLIQCGIDKTTGNVLAWCQDFFKVYDPGSGKALYDSDVADGGPSAQIKYATITQNPALPLLYVGRESSHLVLDSTSIFDLRKLKFQKKQIGDIIAIAGDGKHIYGRKHFRYCLMNENLDLQKWLNDCSLVTTEIGQQADGCFTTKVDYRCSFTQQSDLPDDNSFAWNIHKLNRMPAQDQLDSLDARHVTRNALDISLLPKTVDFLSGHPPAGDTIVITRQAASKTILFIPGGLVSSVDVDSVRKLVLTVANVSNNNFLYVHDFSGKPIKRYLLQLKQDLFLYNNSLSLTADNQFVIIRMPDMNGNINLSAYSLATGKPVYDTNTQTGMYTITPNGNILTVQTHPETDTLYTHSLSTGATTLRRMRFNSFNNGLIVYFEPEADWYKGNFMLYPQHGKVIVEDIVTHQRRCEILVTNDDIHGGITSPDQKYLAYPDRNGNIKLVDIATKKVLAELTGHTDEVRKLYFTPDNASLVSSSDDGTMRLWDIAAKKETLKVVNFGRDGYIILSPKGYYRSSRTAMARFGYVAGNRVLDAGQLDVRFNRPDKVLSETGSKDTALISAYHRAYIKRIARLGIDTAAFKPGYSLPAADFANREAITYEQTNQTLKLHVTGRDSNFTLDRFNVWVNNTPVYGTRGISLKARNSHQLDTTVTVSLSDSINLIETGVINSNGTASERMPLYVSYHPAKPHVRHVYFVGIGIDHFAAPGYNLQWSVKDIRDLAVKFRQKYGANCSVDTLFNEKVSLDNVNSLKTKLKQCGVNDEVVVAYSGHGLLNDNYDYYLSAYDVDFDHPEHNGIPYESLENLLDEIPARHKLMLVDACHSGEVDKQDLKSQKAEVKTGNAGGRLWQRPKGQPKLGVSGSFELMQELFADVSQNSGATIIAAAAGKQLAIERGDLSNGIFTYSILDYMNHQPHCNLSVLKAEVTQRVAQLSHGVQVPNTRSENNAVDWQVW